MHRQKNFGYKKRCESETKAFNFKLYDSEEFLINKDKLVMKFLIAFLVIALLAITAGSAQRGDPNRKLAVMLAYRPNSEIRTRDMKTNKSRTFTIAESEEESSENVNQELLEALIKEKLAKRFDPSDFEDRRTVKRENKHSESHEYSDEAKVVEVEKKVCYKNTYKNVLNAFEEALKSQIENYKKCVCQKKKPTTTTTTTTEASTTGSHKLNEKHMDEEDDDHHDSKISINNDDAIESALDHKDDIICFHRQYAFMLNKLLDHIPCTKHKKAENPIAVDKFKGETVKRAERNNKFIEEYQDLEGDSESVEIDVAEITSAKPKTTTTIKPVKKVLQAKNEKFDQEKMNEQILAILKEHLGTTTEKSLQKKHESSTKKQQMSPKKITIKARQVEDEEEEAKESQESSQQQFVTQLQELFQKYQVTPDETFPLQSNEHHAESTSSLPLRKSSRKSPVKNTVNESSDESTEASFKLKNRKLEKERVQLRENSRKTSAGRNSIADDRGNAKSYRSAPRSDDTRNNSAEDENVRRIVNNNAKKSKHSRPSHDNRLAADLAKKVSDFARGKASKN